MGSPLVVVGMLLRNVSIDVLLMLLIGSLLLLFVVSGVDVTMVLLFALIA